VCCRRAFDFGSGDSQTDNTDTLGTSLFVVCLDLEGVYDKDLHVRAVAVVDQDWASQGSGDDAPSPRIPPQSHLVNARTNPDWDAEWMGHRVKGTLDWFSPVGALFLYATPSLGKKGIFQTSVDARLYR
jgi:hypothetical protein